MRMFYCDPFGRTDVDSVKSSDFDLRREHTYVFFLDQEPINLNRQRATFEHVKKMSWFHVSDQPILITSEFDSDPVQQVCQEFGYRSACYFFHGWAALDWYRGYDRSYLMPAPRQRNITHTFLSPNRIIAGDRWHRTVMFYHLKRRGLHHNHVSFPIMCPVEHKTPPEITMQFIDRYPDIQQVVGIQMSSPLTFTGENDHPMHSYKLSLFQEASESLLYFVTETVADGSRQHLTEKIFKPICLQMPFVLLSTQHSLRYLRSYGFKTFSEFWDESYDNEPDVFRRMEMIADLLLDLDRRTQQQKQDLFDSMRSILEYNYQHFYRGGFVSKLDQELQELLNTL